MKILGIDIGSRDIKCALWEDGNLSIFKDIDAVAKLPSSIIEPDKNEDYVELNGGKYYVGKTAISMKNSTHFSTTNWDGLKDISPIVTKKYLNKIPDIDFIVFDISCAYIDRDKELISHIITQTGLDANKVSIIPQGIGCKLAFDVYGLDPFGNNPNQIKSYHGMDIGFNTIDFWHVSDSILTSDGVSGKEGTGLVIVAEKLREYCKKYTEYSLSHIKDAMYNRSLIYRGSPIPEFKSKLEEYLNEYFDNLINDLESNHKEILDIVSNLIVFGGGGQLLKDKFMKYNNDRNNNFIIIPEKSEYYNAIGLVAYILKRDKLI